MNAKRSRGPLGPAKQGMPGALPGKVERERGESVQVVVRCRPMSRKEEGQGHTQIIDMWPQRGIVHITKPRKAPGRASARMFTFDSVYDWNSNQDDLYENTVKPLVYSVLDGYNGTIFAYGQTGTGKTYTMLGSQQQQGQGAREKGISSKCFEDIFRHIAYTSDRTSYVVRASYFEIYQEETRDLLSPEPGQGHGQGDRRQFSLLWGEDAVRGVYVKGLQSVVCKNIKAIERVMRVGNVNRATAATNMNEHSSRSHAIFQITIEMRDAARRPGVKPGQGPLTAPVQGSGFRMGKLNLVDLAGSERQCKTGAVGDRLKESSKINLSLSALGNVISALVDGRAGQGHRHIPYRDSKLTQLLQDSLGGNSKAIMIANIGPASYNYDESLMTLRYASRAKHIKNMPTRNVNALASLGARVARGPRSALSHYNEEMRALKKLIMADRMGGKADPCSTTTSSAEDS
ncbi:kinesin-II 95 kDa subunit-like, partial [Thrips palmi]|uniref:Kinesin-like protein n=1 Tax=Thrips palmi TaxID=161013 RepID=A0A6P8YBW7_THRPL